MTESDLLARITVNPAIFGGNAKGDLVASIAFDQVGSRKVRGACHSHRVATELTHGLCLGEPPGVIENFLSRSKEAHRIVPPFRDR